MRPRCRDGNNVFTRLRALELFGVAIIQVVRTENFASLFEADEIRHLSSSLPRIVVICITARARRLLMPLHHGNEYSRN